MAMTFEEVMRKFEGMEIDPRPIPLIYFVSAKDRPRHPIKIGRTTDFTITKRLSALQTGQPFPLEFLFIVPAEPEVETVLHHAFAHLRLRGEWFKRGKALLQYLRDVEEAYPDWERWITPRIRLRYKVDA